MTERWLTGIGVGGGVAVGRAIRMAEPLTEPVDRPSHLDASTETKRAQAAIAVVADGLREAAAHSSGSAQEILEAQALIAADPSLWDVVAAGIAASKTAERAVYEAIGTFAATLEVLGGYLGERAADLHHIGQRIIAHLLKVPYPGVPSPGFPFVLVARDLAPADTAFLDEQVLAIVTEEGGPTAHTAILARERRIPAVVACPEARRIADGDEVVVDASGGEVVLAPSETVMTAARDRAQAWHRAQRQPIRPGRLADGTPVAILANLGSVVAAHDAVAAGAEGVGLFRTEFLFLDAEHAPSIVEQQRAYAAVFGAFTGRKVVVRALDAGADKPLAFLGSGVEENPALGVRGFRALQRREVVLREQLTAIAAAAGEHPDTEVWVMAPMVTTHAETVAFTTLAHELGLKVAGIMIEVPAAAMLARELLAVTDFASIGTNDLTQYTMAADRMLGPLASLQDPWHPAVLQLIAAVGEAGQATGRPVGVCGEAAADPLLAVVLVGLGLTSLSMSPAAFPDVRAALEVHTLASTQAAARAALATVDAAGARAAAQAALASS